MILDYNKSNMRILGIDPGYGIVGFGVIDKISSANIQFVNCGVIKTDKNLSFSARLDEICNDLKEIISKYSPDVCAIEELFFAKNVTTGLKVAEARGVISYVLFKAGLSIYNYTPLQVKLALTGDGRAAKSDVKKMVQLFLNYSAMNGGDDAIDALGVALTHSNFMVSTNSLV